MRTSRVRHSEAKPARRAEPPWNSKRQAPRPYELNIFTDKSYGSTSTKLFAANAKASARLEPPVMLRLRGWLRMRVHRPALGEVVRGAGSPELDVGGVVGLLNRNGETAILANTATKQT